MESEIQLQNNTEFVTELQDCAKLLIEKLQGDQFTEASVIIGKMLKSRDQHIFQSVGRLTRGLHSAIVNFNVDADFDVEPPTVERSEIKDASNRLTYVIDLTQAAADKTMDMVEASAPIAMNLGQEASSLHHDWKRLKRRDMTPNEFRNLYKRMDEFLLQMETGTSQISKNLQDIILEQGFQDLTGQVLKRVISLISDVEQDLVSLVRIAGQVEEITGLSDADDNTSDNSDSKKKVEAEGPQIHADIREDVVSNQDEVDDLLSSLGF